MIQLKGTAPLRVVLAVQHSQRSLYLVAQKNKLTQNKNKIMKVLVKSP